MILLGRKFNIKQTVLLLLGALLLVAIYYLLFHDAMVNDRRLSQITRQLQALPPPPGTTQLSSNAAVGLLQGNGNHCDYFVGAAYQSQSSAEDIQKHYQGRQFQNPITETLEEWEITILKDQDTFKSLYLPYQFDQPGAWGLPPQSYAGGSVYLVHTMRSYDANGDFRCH